MDRSRTLAALTAAAAMALPTGVALAGAKHAIKAHNGNYTGTTKGQNGPIDLVVKNGHVVQVYVKVAGSCFLGNNPVEVYSHTFTASKPIKNGKIQYHVMSGAYGIDLSGKVVNAHNLAGKVQLAGGDGCISPNLNFKAKR